MSKDFEVGVSPDESHVYVRVMRSSITLELAKAFTRDLTQLGDTAGISRCLIDVRGAKSIAGVFDEYRYAYEEAGFAGLSGEWRIALLKDRADNSHDFLKTVMGNAGWRYKYFENEREAIDWLKGV
jgi:hypothetical protein